MEHFTYVVHMYFQNMSKRSSCITAVGSFNLLHAFIIPKCLLSIFLSPHLSSRLFSRPIETGRTLRPVSNTCPSLSLPVCLPFCNTLIFSHFSVKLIASLLTILPTNLPAATCQAIYICTQFCMPFCLLNAYISLPGFLPVLMSAFPTFAPDSVFLRVCSFAFACMPKFIFLNLKV
jgi:hypothetical protein